MYLFNNDMSELVQSTVISVLTILVIILYNEYLVFFLVFQIFMQITFTVLGISSGIISTILMIIAFASLIWSVIDDLDEKYNKLVKEID